MHQKTSYEFDTGKGQFFPLPFVPVIFHRKSDGSIIHTDDAMIANSNPMGIFSKIINHRLCTMKGFLTIRDPIPFGGCRAIFVGDFEFSKKTFLIFCLGDVRKGKLYDKMD